MKNYTLSVFYYLFKILLIKTLKVPTRVLVGDYVVNPFEKRSRVCRSQFNFYYRESLNNFSLSIASH